MAFKQIDMDKINGIKSWGKQKQVIYSEASEAIKQRSEAIVDYLADKSHFAAMLEKSYLSETGLQRRKYFRQFSVSVELMATVAENFGTELDATLEDNHSIHKFWSGCHAPDYNLPTVLNLYANLLVEMNEQKRASAMGLVHSCTSVAPSKLDTALLVKERLRERIEQEGDPASSQTKYTISAKSYSLANLIKEATSQPQLPYDSEIERLAEENTDHENYSLIHTNSAFILAMAIMSEMPLDYYVARDYLTRTADCAYYRDADGQLHRLSDVPWLVQDCVDYLMLNRDDQAKLLPEVVKLYLA